MPFREATILSLLLFLSHSMLFETTIKTYNAARQNTPHNSSLGYNVV